jgi:hypothetical protein
MDHARGPLVRVTMGHAEGPVSESQPHFGFNLLLCTKARCSAVRCSAL